MREKEEVNCCATKKERKMEYKNMSSEELKKERKVCLDQYEQCQEMGLSLDLSRGKPGKEQLALSMDMLGVLGP